MTDSQGYNGKLGRVLFLPKKKNLLFSFVWPLYPCESIVWFSCYINKKQSKKFADLWVYVCSLTSKLVECVYLLIWTPGFNFVYIVEIMDLGVYAL